jgi:hypothetical protein
MKLVSAILYFSLSAFSFSAFANCPSIGDSKETSVWILDTLKNRTVAPASVNPEITLQSILASGDDSSRFDQIVGATITGYVVAVKRGGLESCNCHSKINRDWHIELGATPDAKPTERVIVEITPRFPVVCDPGGFQIGNPRELIGHRVQVTGWMFFDEEHKQNARNTNPKGTDLWRATCWEIHPVSAIRKIDDGRLTFIRSPFPPKAYPPDRWLDELRQGEIDIDEYRSLIAGRRDLSLPPFDSEP